MIRDLILVDKETSRRLNEVQLDECLESACLQNSNRALMVNMTGQK